jgi:hypothetical protein
MVASVRVVLDDQTRAGMGDEFFGDLSGCRGFVGLVRVHRIPDQPVTREMLLERRWTRNRSPGSRRIVVAVRGATGDSGWLPAVHHRPVVLVSSLYQSPTRGQPAGFAIATAMNSVAEAKNGSVARWCSHCSASCSVR